MPLSSPLRRSAEQRQGEIVETVIRLAAQGSPGRITTQDIADAIGITQGAIFRHYPNKEAIWLAVMARVEGELLAALDSAAAGAPTPLAALRHVFCAHVDFIAAMPGLPRLIFHELQQAADTPLKAAVRRLLERYRALLARLLAAARASGELDADLDTGVAATLFIGTIQGLVMQSMLTGDPVAMRATAADVLPLLLRGLGARP